MLEGVLSNIFGIVSFSYEQSKQCARFHESSNADAVRSVPLNAKIGCKMQLAQVNDHNGGSKTLEWNGNYKLQNEILMLI